MRFFSVLFFLSVALAKRSRLTTLPTTPTTLPPLTTSTEEVQKVQLDLEKDVDSLLNPEPLTTPPWNLLSAENGSSLILFDEYLYDRFNKSIKNEGLSVPMESFNNMTVFVNEHFRLLYHFLYDLNNYINNIKYNTKLYGRSFCDNSECELQHVTLPECPSPTTTPSWNVPNIPRQPNGPATTQRQLCIPRGRPENRSSVFPRFPQVG